MSNQRSSSSLKFCKYDVFLSFGGDDEDHALYNFSHNLFAALRGRGLHTFSDEERIKKRDSINLIEQSYIYVIVFSKNYADLICCLDELVKISEVIDHRSYNIVPIFYDVDPSEVRDQSESFERAFAKHEERFGSNNLEKVQRWRRALTQVANLPGWDVRNKSESKVIDNIVEHAVINQNPYSMLEPRHYNHGLIGMQSRAKELKNLLELGSNNDFARFVGICGMGGIGKTSLAALVYDRISHKFDACCFLYNVSKQVNEVNGLVGIQEELLCKALKEEVKILNDEEGISLISTRLGHLKTLIVVDDVDCVEQLEKLVGKSTWFGVGSRIIITTKDESILRAHGVDRIYRVQPLNYGESLQLFCRKAFPSHGVSLAKFQEMIDPLLEWADGFPSAIEMLGSYFSYGQLESTKSRDDHFLTIEDTRTSFLLFQVLKTNFDSLKEEEKEIFLDVACFFEGAEVNYVMQILDYCGFHHGVRVLMDKSLIAIVNGKVRMHKLMGRLGRSIAQPNSPVDPTKWSRVWLYHDFQCIDVVKDRMLPNLRSVDLRNSENLTTMTNFRKMPNLVMLNLEGCTGLLQLDPSIATLRKLKYLNLKNCINLISIPNSLFAVSSLNFLNLAGCSRLAKRLDFDSWRSSLEVKVLSNEEATLLEVFSYSILISFPKKVKHKLAFGCLSRPRDLN